MMQIVSTRKYVRLNLSEKEIEVLGKGGCIDIPDEYFKDLRDANYITIKGDVK